MKQNILLLLMSVLVFSSCDDVFTPANENFPELSEMPNDPNYAQGFLLRGYASMPAYYDNTEYATDDAVSNQLSDGFLKMAGGTWSSSNNPLSRWNDGYSTLQYLHIFMKTVDKITFSTDSVANKLFIRRMKGEVYGLRAMQYYYLLRNHAGFSPTGELLGVPLVLDYQTPTSVFNLPRAPFADCVKQIYSDLDSAEIYLPLEYNDLSQASSVPAKFQDITNSVSIYNRVMGQSARQLFNALIAKSFRTKVALLAASPAFQDAKNPVRWADAADYAASVIDYNIATNGTGYKYGIAQNGATYYANNPEVDGLSLGLNPKEIIWRNNLQTNNTDQETQNYPPSVGGSGNMNPTQNLVDAFPMANGYPINYSDATKSGYDPTKPYAGRDPRLSSYIIYNGASGVSVSNATIYTGTSAPTDGINKRVGYSTRTGYYMKKRLRMDINLLTTPKQGKNHYLPRIRYTEIYLSYAEAANEAWGPMGKGTHSYSAYDIIKAIRNRSNPALNAGDPYLDECAADQAKMRELIRNERRIELSFESFRFWDLRRWKVDLAKLNETATGMDVNSVAGSAVYSPFVVEPRAYTNYMYYGPIPFSEVLKYSNLVQNQGW